ncbi:hypothetical protein BJ912DRAFT_1018026 [Pholiota molesta]|nr:hypothetical protein BJ912DRAFT_1018026 [Pholiota molesta]
MLYLRPLKAPPTEHDSAGLGSQGISLKPSSEPRSPKRLNICAFQPLPSIIASPISRHLQPVLQDPGRRVSSSSASAESSSSLRVLFPTSPPPTWIATPPTPPSKYIRRSNTTSTRRYPPVSVSPSASFPASMHPHAARSNEKTNIRRSVSVPALSFHPAESWSDHSIEDVREREKTKDALRNTTFGRASSSFASGPWIHSYTQLQATALASSSTLPDTAQNPTSSVSATLKEPSKANSRYLFSDNELESLTRNAEEMLQLHEHFVKELRNDLGHEHLANLNAAIRAVSTKFATEASRFNAYQSFCAGHAEAVDILRKAYIQFPIELDAFESRCMNMVSEMFKDGTTSEPRRNRNSTHSAGGSPTAQTHLTAEDRKRTLSLTSLDGATRSLRPRSSMIMNKDSVPFPLEPRREKASPRIAFADYMIKPIQRICKYPLLLDQLLPSKALRALSQNAPDMRSDVDVVVESAAQAMRHVASSVDEARHKQDVATQSALIFSRAYARFLASLGDCLLSGSLDVIHYSSYFPLGQNSSIKVKYLGAFLYPGGKKYEPRHWFSLAEFEVLDVDDDGAMLPCSFKLSSGDNHFELAAACQREKDEWLSSIHEALKHTASWSNEPTPSYKFDVKGELLPESDDGLSEYPSLLSTIRSIPEGGNASDAESSEPFFASLRGSTKPKRKRTGYETPPIFRQDLPPGPSRRSSSTSVKAIFSPMASDTETVVIRRSSHVARIQVDQELQDVISQSCLTARSYAYSHEVELFQAPKATRSGSARSNSAIGMAGMGRLSKHESYAVSRGASILNGATYSSSVQIQDLAPSPLPSPPSSMSSSSPQCPRSSASSTRENYAIDARSFVRNVRGLFHFRPISPVSPISVIVSHPSRNSIHPAEHQLAPLNAIHRWTKDSLRRHSRIDVP